MNPKPPCSHEHPIFMGEESRIDEICDDCMEKILNHRSDLHFIFNNEGNYQMSSADATDISWQINLFESVSSGNQLPSHLQEYVTSNLLSPRPNAESIVVKLYKKGVQLLESHFPMEGYSPERIPMPQVRNGVVGESLKLRDNLSGISYHLVGEGENSLYLSIRLENAQSRFDELSVRKNNRLIHSMKIDKTGTADISGLVGGEYTITLHGTDTKQLKIQILDD